jgi:hypothetical protein
MSLPTTTGLKPHFVLEARMNGAQHLTEPGAAQARPEPATPRKPMGRPKGRKDKAPRRARRAKTDNPTTAQEAAP